MSESTEPAQHTASAHPTEPRHPTECDVIMKGGVTSGVVYPRALQALSMRYKFRGIGGTSAGAIGAACAAAAELGRGTGGFEKLGNLPAQLGRGQLARLFQPQQATRPLLPLLMAMAGNGLRGKGPKNPYTAAPLALIWGFPVTATVALLAVIAFVIIGRDVGGWPGASIALLGALLALIIGVVALVGRVYWKLAHAVPANQLGICRGLSEREGQDGFTDWLSDTIDDLAGLPKRANPVTFGDLWGDDPDAEGNSSARAIDLRMITTCISRSRPYEMPWAAKDFFYDPAVWRTLFPAYVMKALEDRSAPAPAVDAAEEDLPVSGFSAWVDQAAEQRGLRRLPGPRDLPVIVATRMSLSFPLLISAVPLWSVDLRSSHTRALLKTLKTLKAGQLPAEPPDFQILWFTDGGLCSNFPVHMFDSPLPSRPTYAINLGRFADDAQDDPTSDQPHPGFEIARNNRDGLLPSYRVIESEGRKAVMGFAGAALDTIRNWQDNSYLDVPGHRDRIVRILQTKSEGGLNLYMGGKTIDALAARGEAGADALIDQFTQKRYKTVESPTRDGWENHRWVRFRALMATLPDFLTGYSRGKDEFGIKPADPPSYPMSMGERGLAAELVGALDGAAAAIKGAEPDDVDGLKSSPARAGTLRRTPRM